MRCARGALYLGAISKETPHFWALCDWWAVQVTSACHLSGAGMGMAGKSDQILAVHVATALGGESPYLIEHIKIKARKLAVYYRAVQGHLDTQRDRRRWDMGI